VNVKGNRLAKIRKELRDTEPATEPEARKNRWMTQRRKRKGGVKETFFETAKRGRIVHTQDYPLALLL